MLSVPVRLGPLVGPTEKLTVPLPLPEVAPLNVIHGTSADADQSHPAAPETPAEPLPPPAPKLDVGTLTDNEHPADCVIGTSCPAITTLPERVGPLAPLTTTCATPGPLPVVPCAMLAQATLLDDVHGQPALVLMLTLLVPPAEGTEMDPGLTE
jgi:hypothetical protein